MDPREPRSQGTTLSVPDGLPPTVPAPFFYLREDERVLLRDRTASSYALVLLVWPAIGLSALLGGALVARALVPRLAFVPEWAPWAVWGALLAIAAFAAWRRAITTEHALTDQRIYARVGRLITQLHFTTHDKVTDIRYRQGPLERLLGIASLTFATAGAEVHVPGIPNALALKTATEAARDAFIRELLQEAPGVVAAPASVAPSPAALPPAPSAPVVDYAGPRPDYLQAGDVPVWFAIPRPIAAVSSLRSLLGLLPVLYFTSILDGARRTYASIALVGLALLS